jgi:hypothetical protein
MRGFIIESEWRNGKGWRFFASELRVVVYFSLSIHGGRGKKSTSKFKATTENGGNRSFGEVLLSMDKASPTTSQMRKPPTKEAESPLESKGCSMYPKMLVPK